MTTPNEDQPAGLSALPDTACSHDLERKLREYLDGLKKQRDEITTRLHFCNQHNFHREVEWLREQRSIMSDIYVGIHNEVLDEFF